MRIRLQLGCNFSSVCSSLAVGHCNVRCKQPRVCIQVASSVWSPVCDGTKHCGNASRPAVVLAGTVYSHFTLGKVIIVHRI